MNLAARGALAGTLVGLNFAAIETLLADAGGTLLSGRPEASLASAALGACVYAAAGAVLGVAATLRARDDRAQRAVVTCALLVLSALQLALSVAPNLRWAFALLLTVALAAGAGLTTLARSPRWLEALCAPLPAFAIALGVPWVTLTWLDDRDLVVKLASACALIAIAAVLAFALRGLPRRPPLAHALAALLLWMGVAGGIAFVVPRTVAPIDVRPTAPAPSRALPNVVLISLDTVRADHLSAYGHSRPTSPGLERFAKHATLYVNSYSASDMTLASHASMFTGLYAMSHGAHYTSESVVGAPLDVRHETLAEGLAAAGYRTLGVVANVAYLARKYELNQGFQYWDDGRAVALLRSAPAYFLRASWAPRLRALLPQKAWEKKYRDASEITRATLSALDARPRDDRPQFVFVNYMDAHWPYLPPARFREANGVSAMSIDEDALNVIRLGLWKQTAKPSAEALGELSARYDASIAYVDAEVERLLGELERRGVLEGALVIITSDHGEALGEHDLIAHSISVYQDQIRVPLLVRFPGQREGVVDAEVVHGVDLLPTVFDVAGLPIPAGRDGVSLRAPHAGRTLISESYPSGLRAAQYPRFDRLLRAAIHGDTKLIESSVAAPELYDLAADAGELNDLSQRLPEQSEPLRAALRDELARARKLEASGPAPTLDANTEEALRALGYME